MPNTHFQSSPNLHSSEFLTDDIPYTLASKEYKKKQQDDLKIRSVEPWVFKPATAFRIKSLQKLVIDKVIKAVHPFEHERIRESIKLLVVLSQQSATFCKLPYSLDLRIRANHNAEQKFCTLKIKPEFANGDIDTFSISICPDQISVNANPSDLTAREKEVLQLIASGFSNKQIAAKLCISIHTAINHRKHLITKFNVKNTAEMIRDAGRSLLV